MLSNFLIGFVFSIIVISVSNGQQLDESFETNPWQSDETSSYLFDRQYNPTGGSARLTLPPSASSAGVNYHGAETFSRPVIIVSGRGLKDQAEIRQVRGSSATRSNKVKYEVEEDDESEDSPTVVVETKKKKKKVDQPISAYVPTAYVIGNQGAGQPVSRVKQESDKGKKKDLTD